MTPPLDPRHGLPGMGMRHEAPWDDTTGDVGMWVLLPLMLSLGGGFLVFIAIFAGEPELDLIVGGLAAILGVTIATLMRPLGFIVALVLIAVGAFGGWVWEQFRDGASIRAVTYVGEGYDGSHWVGHVHNYEERIATVTCHLDALGPDEDVIGSVELTATDVRPNSNQPVEGEIDVPRLTGPAVQASITARRNVRGTCTTEVG